MALEHGKTLLPETFAIRVPVAGCLKIGDVVRNGEKIQPKKLDYIRYCGPQPTKDGQYPDHPDFAELNKSKPRKVRIELFSDDPTVCLEINRVMANRGSVLCKGDGHDAWRRMNDKGQNDPLSDFKKCPEGTCGDHCPFAKARQCKIHSCLRFRITGATPLGYVWQFRSTAWNTAQDLLGSMAAIKELTGGTLARLPLDLTISEQRRRVNTPKGPINSTFWTVGLAFNGDELDLIEALERIEKIKDGYARLKLDSVEAKIVAMQKTGTIMSDLDDVDQEKAFALEFFPDGEDGTDTTKMPDLDLRPHTMASTSPSPAATPAASAPPAADPKPKTQRTKTPATTPAAAIEEPMAMDMAYSLVHAARGYEGLTSAFKTCMLSFSYHSTNPETPKDVRLAAATENVRILMEDIDEFESIAGQDEAGDRMLEKVEEYAETIRANGGNIPERKPSTAPDPASTSPTPVAAPAKAYPHTELRAKVDGIVADAVKCRTDERMMKLKSADAAVRSLFLKHCDNPGIDLGNGRVQLDQGGCDVAYTNARQKATAEIKSKGLPQLDSYELLVQTLYKQVIESITTWLQV